MFGEIMKKNGERYEEIKHLQEHFTFKRTPGYAKCAYVATTNNPEAMELSSHDVALLADYGNLCFGGRDFRKRISDGVAYFSGVVHTD